QIARAENLEIVRRGMAGDGEILLVLPHDLMAEGAGEAIAAEAANCEIVAVVYEPCDGVLHGHQLIDQGARLTAKELTGSISGVIGKYRPRAFLEWIGHAIGSAILELAQELTEPWVFSKGVEIAILAKIAEVVIAELDRFA